MPALASVMGFELEEVDPGRITVRACPGDAWCNPGGLVSGGFIGALLDEASGWAVASSLPAERNAVTLSASTRFLRAHWPNSGALRCVATMRTSGRRVATVDAQVTGDADRGIATMASTYLVIEARTP